MLLVFRKWPPKKTDCVETLKISCSHVYKRKIPVHILFSGPIHILVRLELKKANKQVRKSLWCIIFISLRSRIKKKTCNISFTQNLQKKLNNTKLYARIRIHVNHVCISLPYMAGVTVTTHFRRLTLKRCLALPQDALTQMCKYQNKCSDSSIGSSVMWRPFILVIYKSGRPTKKRTSRWTHEA